MKERKVNFSIFTFYFYYAPP